MGMDKAGNMENTEKKFSEIPERNNNEDIEKKADLVITITSFNRAFIEWLDEELFVSFLCQNNFGTRQTKGFGSFFPVNYSTDKIPDELRKRFFEVPTSGLRSDREKQELVFTYIELFYKAIRSGINIPGKAKNISDDENKVVLDRNTLFYIKPALFVYAMNKIGVQWDKKA